MQDFSGLRPIALSDAEAVGQLYARFGRGDSAHAFPSLYVWQEEMELRLLTGEGFYSVRCGWKGPDAWFFPVGEDSAKEAFLRGLKERGPCRLCYMTEEDVRFLESRFPGEFAVRETPEDSEYIYDRQQTASMPGKAFEKIRNRYRRLEREHQLTARPLTPELLSAAAEITAQWNRHTDTGEGILDTRATARILKEWTALNLRGVLLFLDGEPWGVAAGYGLGRGHFDCCLMKARESLPGVADHLRVRLAESLEGDFTYLNLEEDLGVEGLRQMKERLRPCDIIRMYTGETA